MNTERQTESQGPSLTLFSCSYDQGNSASHMAREAVALIPLYGAAEEKMFMHNTTDISLFFHLILRL